MLDRFVVSRLEAGLSDQKVALLVGARRVGKTELLKALYSKYLERSLWLNGEDTDTIAVLEQRSEANYRRLLGSKNLLIIDEAQYVPDISRKVKLMIDTIAPLHIIMTGSSAFDLVQTGQPLVGRMQTFFLYPIAQMEWETQENALQTRQNLEDRLIYGSYPELMHIQDFPQKQVYLKELVRTYLLKDILAFEDIRNAQKILDILQLLAWQIGSEVSMDKLARQLSISKNTVEKYLDLLTKVFVLYSRRGFSSNLRKEVSKSKRWYFVDNGIRNAVINDFSPLSLRRDTGMLWEQYFLSERMKYNEYTQNLCESYFWRTYDQQEIDLVESKDRHLTAFECKWKPMQAKVPTAFAKAYSEAAFQVVHPENYLSYIV